MRFRSKIIVAISILSAMGGCCNAYSAENTPGKWVENARQKAKAQRKRAEAGAKAKVKAAREKANELFADALRRGWSPFSPEAPVEKPQDKPITPPAPPVKPIERVNKPILIEEVMTLPSLLPPLEPLIDITIEDLNLPPTVVIEDNGVSDDKPEKSPVPIPENTPQPKPEERPEENTPIARIPCVELDFFGAKITLPEVKNIGMITGVSEEDIASGWSRMSLMVPVEAPAALLKARDELDLCDWACLQLAEKYADTVAGINTNTGSLLFAWLMSQMGYDIKLGRSGNKIIPLFASDYLIYQHPYFSIKGKRYYPLDKRAGTMTISPATFPGSRPVAMTVGKRMKFPSHPAAARRLSAKGVDAKVVTDKNLLDFYDRFPASQYENTEESRWAILASTPLSSQAEETLYPAVRKAVEGMDKADAVDTILRYLQSGLEYRYDEEIWGADRAFFPEETLYYPYADCEDRASLFVRMVKDIVGLDAALVVYPGHVAAAVAFPTPLDGDYITIKGKKFLICDPTYIGVGIGVSMPELRNESVKVIEI